MVYKKGAFEVTVNENMRGGDGSVTIEHFLGREGLYDKGRLYAKLTMKPGSSIGFHKHENEMETFFVIKGTAEFDDNGEKKALEPGDVAYTPDGAGHSVKNIGAGDLEMIALIIDR
jgi:mannose-6-phosphate isomerase-like protein (cupin superfamily)